MILRLMLIGSLFVLAACAHGEPALPGCEGSARRPANPHGSVLSPMPAPSPEAGETASTPGGCA